MGGYPAVSLADARQAALDNAKAIKEGRDPLAEKREAVEARKKPATPTFAEAAATVIELRRPTWSNEKHAYQWTQSLSTYAFQPLATSWCPTSTAPTSSPFSLRSGLPSRKRPGRSVSVLQPSLIGRLHKVTASTTRRGKPYSAYCQRCAAPNNTIRHFTITKFRQRCVRSGSRQATRKRNWHSSFWF